MTEQQIAQNQIKKKGSDAWAATLQPLLKNGKINPEFVKVYGEQRIKEIEKGK